jgi:hypothetical protein
MPSSPGSTGATCSTNGIDTPCLAPPERLRVIDRILTGSIRQCSTCGGPLDYPLEPACCRCARSSPWSQRTPPRATDGKPGKSGNLFGRWTFPTLQFPGKLSLVHA